MCPKLSDMDLYTYTNRGGADFIIVGAEEVLKKNTPSIYYCFIHLQIEVVQTLRLARAVVFVWDSRLDSRLPREQRSSTFWRRSTVMMFSRKLANLWFRHCRQHARTHSVSPLYNYTELRAAS